MLQIQPTRSDAAKHPQAASSSAVESSVPEAADAGAAGPKTVPATGLITRPAAGWNKERCKNRRDLAMMLLFTWFWAYTPDAVRVQARSTQALQHYYEDSFRALEHLLSQLLYHCLAGVLVLPFEI